MPLATLGANLVDKLVGVTDRLRRLNNTFGLRQYRVFLLKRSWSGVERGDGYPVISKQEILPVPAVADPKLVNALRMTGLSVEGDIILTEVSLSYREDELSGGDLAANEEFYYQLDDNLGQGIPTRYYVLKDPPKTDRAKTLGWVLTLERAEVVL